jgi:hypothetical protein
MSRASEAQKAERLNRARVLLRQTELPEAVKQLARDCSISSRQAYRYLQQAQRLKEPVPVSEPKLAFTVKLPYSLVQRVRLYASVKKISISEVVSRALWAFLPRGGRSWLSRGQSRHVPFGWNIDLTACQLTNWLRLMSCCYLNDGGRLEGHPPNHSILIRR